MFYNRLQKNIKLGQKVKDSITGFSGRAVEIRQYIGSASVVSVAPTSLDHNGNPREEYIFPMDRLEVIEEG